MIVVNIVRLGYDDFPIGAPRKIYGPFDDYDQAREWIKKKFPFNGQFDRFEALLAQEKAIVSTINLLPPD